MKFIIRIYEDVKVNGIPISLESQIIIINIVNPIHWEGDVSKDIYFMNSCNSIRVIFDDPEFFLEGIKKPKDVRAKLNIFSGISVWTPSI